MSDVNQYRGTGRTTRILLRAVTAIASGMTVAIVFRNRLSRDHATQILIGAGMRVPNRVLMLVTLDQVEHLQGIMWTKNFRVFLDHDVRAAEGCSRQMDMLALLANMGVLTVGND